MRHDRTAAFRYFCAVLTILVLLTHLKSVLILTIPVVDLASAMGVALTASFLGGCVFGATGVLGARWWGFAGLYLATFAATLGMSISMIPFVIWLFPVEMRAISLIASNLLFLAGVVGLQLKSSHSAAAV